MVNDCSGKIKGGESREEVAQLNDEDQIDRSTKCHASPAGRICDPRGVYRRASQSPNGGNLTLSSCGPTRGRRPIQTDRERVYLCGERSERRRIDTEIHLSERAVLQGEAAVLECERGQHRRPVKRGRRMGKFKLGKKSRAESKKAEGAAKGASSSSAEQAFRPPTPPPRPPTPPPFNPTFPAINPRFPTPQLRPVTPSRPGKSPVPPPVPKKPSQIPRLSASSPIPPPPSIPAPLPPVSPSSSTYPAMKHLSHVPPRALRPAHHIRTGSLPAVPLARSKIPVSRSPPPEFPAPNPLPSTSHAVPIRIKCPYPSDSPKAHSQANTHPPQNLKTYPSPPPPHLQNQANHPENYAHDLIANTASTRTVLSGLWQVERVIGKGTCPGRLPCGTSPLERGGREDGVRARGMRWERLDRVTAIVKVGRRGAGAPWCSGNPSTGVSSPGAGSSEALAPRCLVDEGREGSL
ncbi:vegetative cell wall protein gp1-like [Ischnura elegans]|uniref:vegetative cell wall protein gp1-like n=1 Tax=Ischnura elegans TaxID=197161 RepID=UPI001ED8AF1E|nr:vegetative cell wall protein gp1-like [Ischnura elegans]